MKVVEVVAMFQEQRGYTVPLTACAGLPVEWSEGTCAFKFAWGKARSVDVVARSLIVGHVILDALAKLFKDRVHN